MMYGSNPCRAWLLTIGAIVAGFGVSASAERPVNRPASRPLVYQANNGAIHAGDLVFQTWGEYAASDFFYDQGLRCGLKVNPDDGGLAELGGGQADCSSGSTNPAEIYAPSVIKYRIQVVVHVIRNDAGTQGNISEALAQSQIDILNEDFLAIPGTNGEPGTDVQIEFFLATEDPDGNPTTGITYSNNTTWFNDGGAYYNTLAWDPFHYLNIYTNSASGALGYVPWLPQGGAVGSNADRVVCLWSAFGRNAPIGHPFNLGRTVTHEVGHYLGLYHTFQNGCGTTQCYITGDRICDTNSESNPHFGCPNSTSCGTVDPVHNYMDYADDPCMWEFTPEQARRSRCTLEHWRPDLAVVTQETTVVADAVEIVRGVLVGGDVTDLADSDDSRLLVNSGITLQAGEPPVWVVVDGTAPSASPSSMRFVVESSVSTPGASQTLELYNYNTDGFEEVDVRVAGVADALVQVELTGDLSRFIEAGTLSMQAQLSYQPPLLTLAYPWQVGLDQVIWAVAP